MNFYPLQFKPILKNRIWGGTKLKTILNKPIDSNSVGESWEISSVENEVSIVLNGAFSGINLNDLILQYPNEILGVAVHQKFGFQFPLLFKYLDAKLDLSIQVHPNDQLAQKRHATFGKTEMWYVLQADSDAELIVGFANDCSEQQYIDAVNNKSLMSLLATQKVQQGDVFFLNTGTVHAIGAGTLIAEIQQTSDITYRIFDFDRVDENGNKRELHTDLALEAINYNKIETKINYSKKINFSNLIIDCPYFTTNLIPLQSELQVLNTYKSFIVYMCVDGYVNLNVDDQLYSYNKGDTFLVPAIITNFTLTGCATILEIYIL